MAVIGIEGFDHHRSGDPSAFDNGATFSVVTGASTRFNYGQAVTSSFNGQWNVNNQNTIIQGVAYFETSGTSTLDIFTLYQGGTAAGNIQVHLDIDYANRRLRAFRGTGTTNNLGNSANDTIPPTSNWFYVEWKVVIHDSAGSIEVRVDGNPTPVLSLTGIDTQNTASAFVTVANVRCNARIDDYYLFDGSGSQFNDFFGDARVFTEYPVSDNSVNFTPVTGTDNFAMVDDPGDIDGDTTYNSQASTTGKDLFNITGTVPVAAVIGPSELRTTIRKDDAGVCTGRGVIKSDATESPGATRNPGTSYVQYRDVYELDPDGNVAWTVAQRNAIKIGYERLT